jgi:hypothetical protein
MSRRRIIRFILYEISSNIEGRKLIWVGEGTAEIRKAFAIIPTLVQDYEEH